VTQSIVVPVVEMKFGVKIAKNTVFVWGRRGLDRVVVGFTTTCAISAYHH